MLTSDFDYQLPPEFIAQQPIEPRDSARLMVLNRQSSKIEHAFFSEIGRYLTPGDLLVLNETRVIPARLFARKVPGGGRVELLLLRKQSDLAWKALVGGKGVSEGKQLRILDKVGEFTGLVGKVLAILEGAQRLVSFSEPLEPYLPTIGHVPLPPYIHARLDDQERYQTVYARPEGSAAAPTAGLHFTPGLIARLQAMGVLFAKITLHVGLDTFAPVTEDDPNHHRIHSEWCEISEQAVTKIHHVKENGKRVIAVGTTSVRTLETAVANGIVQPVSGPTSVYILPGYRFQVVDGMVTNFHLPRSTLIMLVSAFVGRDKILSAYETAKKEGYRFYSFGDAMLII